MAIKQLFVLTVSQTGCAQRFAVCLLFAGYTLLAGCSAKESEKKFTAVSDQTKAIMNLLDMGTTKDQFHEQLKQLRLGIAEITASNDQEKNRLDAAKELPPNLEAF